MKNIDLIDLILLIIIFICGCTNQEVKFSEKPPKAIFNTDSSGYCDTLRRNAYERLNEGILELVTNYPTTINSDIKKVELFNKELKKRYGMQVLEIYDSFYYKQCIMPIMDSVIISKFGTNSKEKIIKEISSFVDNVNPSIK